MKKTNLLTCFVLFTLLHFLLLVSVAAAGLNCYARDSYSKNFIISVQEMLKANGIDPGPVDGLWGTKTERGIAAFQQLKGLQPTYDLNGPTLRALFGEGFDPKRYGLVPSPGMPAEIFEQHCR